MKIISGIVDQPKRVVLHGAAGVGKTTLACRLGKAIVIPTEDGSNHLDVDRLPLCRNYNQVLESIAYVGKAKKAGEITNDVVVLDSIDWAENFIESQLEAESFDQSYGKGVVEIGARIGRIFSYLDSLMQYGMKVVVIAHSEMKSIELPEGGSYSRWQPKLSKRSNSRLQEWSDAVGYCRIEVMVSKESNGFTERGVGQTTGRRVLHLNPTAGYVAKCRSSIDVPISVDMSNIEQVKKFL